MDVREKLVELANDILRYLPWGEIQKDTAERIADRMMDHGVTVQEWISVKERLPEYGDKVLVCNSENGNIHTAELDGELWHLDCGWLLDVDDFTDWMPWPQPPKGE